MCRAVTGAVMGRLAQFLKQAAAGAARLNYTCFVLTPDKAIQPSAHSCIVRQLRNCLAAPASLRVCVCMCLLLHRLSLPAAGSAAMAFACTTTAAAAAAGGHGASPQHLVLLGLLNGCLVAVSVTELITAQMQLLPSVQPVISSTQQHQQHDSMACKSQAQRAVLTVRWQAQGPAPIFSSPAVESEQGLVIAAAVDGTVTALKLSTGQQLWQVQQHGGQVFADLMLQRLPLLSGAHAGPVTATGTDVSGSAVVVMATKAGNVFCLDTVTGAKVRRGFLSWSACSSYQLCSGKQRGS